MKDDKDRAINVVWLKKDVRSHDHGALSSALQKNRDFIILHIYEPDQLSHPTVHGSHINFANEGLIDLENRISQICRQGQEKAGKALVNQQCLTIASGEATEVLSSIHAIRPINELLAHQETGHWISFQRDKRVRRWCKANNVIFHEFLQAAVFRCLQSRDNYSKKSSKFFTASNYPDISSFHNTLQSHLILGLLPPYPITSAKDLIFVSQHHNEDRPSRQRGGETEAMRVLHTFLNTRGKNYSSGISSPGTSSTSCTRLSAYITYGHISLRYVMKKIIQKQEFIKSNLNFPDRRKWLSSLTALRSRLHWRSHFIQKLESEPMIEKHALCRAYDNVRTLPSDFNPDYFKAWSEGKTGFPMVDACMRCLIRHGWVNFRMRAMLVSFACYNLWLDWRVIADHLARCFIDFEPGIHFPQLQMQAGVTGINAMRVYNVTKQAKDHDKNGYFIRRYVPELASVPSKFISEPAKMATTLQSKIGLSIISADNNINDSGEGKGNFKIYPGPIVDESMSTKRSKAIISDIKRARKTKSEAAEVFLKHGSRKRTVNNEIKNEKKNTKEQKHSINASQPKITQLFSAKSVFVQTRLDSNQMFKNSPSIVLETASSEKIPILPRKTTTFVDHSSWSCEVCTFENTKPCASVCEVCRSKRKEI